MNSSDIIYKEINIFVQNKSSGAKTSAWEILTLHIIKSFISLSTSYGYLNSKNNVQVNAQQEIGFYCIYPLYI